MPPKTSRWSSLSLDTWFWEILALIFGVFAFITIFVILAVLDQKPSPTLPSGITLNTIIFILSTSSKSPLIFAISSAIGQLKWIAFRRGKKPLSDLQLADDAGRGPLGSFWIIVRYKGKDLICLGAAVIMLCLVFGPFMQQILSYPIRITPSKDAKPHLQTISISTPSIPRGTTLLPPSLRRGWCSACSDITASAKFTYDVSSNGTAGRIKGSDNVTDIPCAVPLSSPPGSSSSFTEMQKYVDEDPRILGALSIPVDYIRAIERVNLEKNVTLSGIRNPLAVFWRAQVEVPLNESMWFNPQIHSAIPALRSGGIKLKNVTECVLTPCARKCSVSVMHGVPAIHTSVPKYGDLLIDTSKEGNGDFCWKAPSVTGTSEPANISAIEFTLLYNTSTVGTRVSADQGIICPEEVLSTFTNASNPLTKAPATIISHDVMPKPIWKLLLETSLYDDDVRARIQTVGFEEVMANIAASLTKVGMEISNETMVVGTISVSVVYVRVTWAFITLPTLLLLAGVVFVLVTVHVSRKVDVGLWKTSVLPAFWIGIEEWMLVRGGDESDGDSVDEHRSLSGYQVMSQMDGKARETVVSLGVVEDQGGEETAVADG
ncbi:hypothetical protein BDW74DRAFT_181992 [Aspergillus multicolor]|uniref:DUF3176 domain-containing protein n=1 Tax=Aspergillus multicolor TaxID=41759 RepID=UPI003CCCB1EE